MKPFRIYNNIIDPPIEQKIFGVPLPLNIVKKFFLTLLPIIAIAAILWGAFNLSYIAIPILVLTLIGSLIYVITTLRWSRLGLSGDTQTKLFLTTKKQFPYTNFTPTDPVAYTNTTSHTVRKKQKHNNKKQQHNNKTQQQKNKNTPQRKV